MLVLARLWYLCVFISGGENNLKKNKKNYTYLNAVNVEHGQQTHVCSIGEVVLSVLKHCRPEFTSIKKATEFMFGFLHEHVASVQLAIL